ncbi:TPA: hypothetical protein HA278_06535, partial [Candidatus Woesearchaeota archaeon]|nr:hypothetical protein [Candidatus Woesearchaeota archaeon]
HRIDFADSDVGVLAIYGGVKGAASSLEKAGRKACKEDTLGNRCSIINPYTGKATSEDQYRATIVTATVADAYAARDALHEMVSVDGHHDNSDFYRNERDGYKALHTTLEMNGYSFEIHIVTDKDDRANNERNADDERTHTSFKVRELNRMHSLDGHRVVMVETLGKGAYEVRDIDITNQVRSEGPLRATVISNYNKR